MIHLELQYFSVNKILLLIFGLWPYQQSTFTRFQFIFFSIILTAGIVFQLTSLMTSTYTLNFINKVLSSVSFCTFSSVKCNLFWINIEAIKDLLMQLQHVHNQLKDKNEIAIIEGYNCTARRCTIVLTIFGVCLTFIFIISQYWYNVGDLPKNVSRLPITTQYFIDQEKYFYLILLHIIVIICIGVYVIVAIGTIMISYFLHMCGLFKIACYRIEHAINIHIRQNNITQKNKIWMTSGVIYAVDIHRKAMKLSTHLTSTLETMMFLLIASAVTCTTLNMLQIFQIASSKNIEELFLPSIIILVIILYMFIGNYVGQIIIDHNNHVFSTAYNVQWYRAPLHIQRMILFLLQKESKKFTLNIGGLVSASMECFAMLIKASVSYFTVIYSMR